MWLSVPASPTTNGDKGAAYRERIVEMKKIYHTGRILSVIALTENRGNRQPAVLGVVWHPMCLKLQQSIFSDAVSG